MPSSKEILFITGSPSASSRSSYAASEVGLIAKREGIATRWYSLGDFDANDVLHARVDAPAIKEFVAATREASAIVLSSPVYKAIYSGALKAIVDLIPQDALIGRPALGIATARAAAHKASVERAYRELFEFFRAKTLDPVVLSDDEVKIDTGAGSLGVEAAALVEAAGNALLAALR